MSSNWPKTGPNHAPAYIASGVPFVTQSTGTEVPNAASNTLRFSFPFVTKFFQVENIHGSRGLRVGFSDLGVKGTVTKNFISVAAGQKTDVLDMRCKELYFGGEGGTSAFRIIAGLTMIPDSEFPVLTGSVPGGTGTIPTASFGGVG
tara:strand:- start:70 stop:510 length:441 start_codon:yes stop_codon:yes gene_type:complete